MKLIEIKTKYAHYFQDENGLKQGEYKFYHSNDQLNVHCFYKDDKRHGEHIRYNTDGSLDYKCYFKDGKDVTDMYNKLNVWKSL